MKSEYATYKLTLAGQKITQISIKKLKFGCLKMLKNFQLCTALHGNASHTYIQMHAYSILHKHIPLCRNNIISSLYYKG